MTDPPPTRQALHGLGRWLGVVALVAVVLGIGVLVGRLAIETQDRFRELRTAGLDNMQWSASQLEVDVLRLIAEAQALMLAPEQSLRPLRVRFDVLYSRNQILSRGVIRRELDHSPEVLEGLASLQDFLDRTTPLIDGPDDALRRALPRMLRDLDAVHGATREVVLRALDSFSGQADAQRTALAELLRRAAIATMASMLLLAAMVLVLAWLFRREQATRLKLRDARDAALAGQRAKASFVAVMSHEMRTPLNGVVAALEILRDGKVAQPQAGLIDLAHSSALQLMHQINDVLDISRIEAGRIELARAPIALRDWLEDVARSLGPLAEARGNRIETLLHPDLPACVTGDEFRLRQILQNFLSNAIKFTQDGRITLEARPVAQGAAAVTVEFAVRDTGVGIAPDDLARVFDEFVMLDPTYSREVGGSGLGLAICKRLAELLDGQIGVDSGLHSGSRFWVRLPFGTAPAEAAARAKETAVPGGGAIAMPQLQLLVVDDNAVNRAVIARMLEGEGQQAVLASGGHEAVRLAARRRFDAILMDISMPEMDGVTAAGLIRAGGSSAHSPIYALTAHAMPEELQRFRAAGLRVDLLKPVRLGALRQALARIAAEQPASDSPATPAGLAERRPPAPCPPMLDPATLDEQRALLGPDGLAEVHQQFRSDAAPLLSQIAQAAATGDLALLERHAHELKGAAATLGLLHLAGHMRKLEAAARSGRTGEACALALQSPAEWEATQAALAAAPHCAQA